MDKEIEVSDRITGDVGKWERPAYKKSDKASTNTISKPMRTGAEYEFDF